MNVAQVTQTTEHPTGSAAAEAVRGLARDRTVLVRELRDANRQWVGFPAWEKEQIARIAETDARIDRLVNASIGVFSILAEEK